MIWGGLHPIPGRLAIAILIVVGLSYSTLASITTSANGIVLIASFLLSTSLGGLLCRRPLAFTGVIVLALQGLRRLDASPATTCILTTGSVISILAGAIMSALFPTVQLPPVRGKYHVGMVEFFLPIEKNSTELLKKTWQGAAVGDSSSSRLFVRLWYPTLEKPTYTPYLNPETAVEYCKNTMRYAAPPSLRSQSWMLKAYMLIRLPVKRNASLPPSCKPQGRHEMTQKFPVVVYSHGLGASAQVYAYQAMRLASQGMIVLALNHSDGSAPIVPVNEKGDCVCMDFEVFELLKTAGKPEYVKVRRARAEQRVQEFLGATEALRQMNGRKDFQLPGGLSLLGRLDLRQTFFMGHSFGGATVLTAAARRPEWVQAIIAHDPSVDWMPDDARRALFPPDRCGDDDPYRGGTGGWSQETTSPTIEADHRNSSSIHDRDILFLYSDEWLEKDRGECHMLQRMHERGTLGRAGGVTKLQVVEGTTHKEFTDSTMLSPVWLTRAVGGIGPRSPLETGEEIATITQEWVGAVQSLGLP